MTHLGQRNPSSRFDYSHSHPDVTKKSCHIQHAAGVIRTSNGGCDGRNRVRPTRNRLGSPAHNWHYVAAHKCCDVRGMGKEEARSLLLRATQAAEQWCSSPSRIGSFPTSANSAKSTNRRQTRPKPARLWAGRRVDLVRVNPDAARVGLEGVIHGLNPGIGEFSDVQ